MDFINKTSDESEKTNLKSELDTKIFNAINRSVNEKDLTTTSSTTTSATTTSATTTLKIEILEEETTTTTSSTANVDLQQLQAHLIFLILIAKIQMLIKKKIKTKEMKNRKKLLWV